jgi:hypothetical protein
MRKWIIRMDLRGVAVGEPHCFLEGSPIARTPGFLTLEEYAALHLDQGERLTPEDRLWIDKHGQRVGYFEVLDTAP